MDTSRADPLFIVGAPRSGTTLLRTMLNRHPSIGLCDETFFFYYVGSRQGAFGDLRSLPNRERVVDRYLETHRVRRLGLEVDGLRAALLAEGDSYDRLFLALLQFYAASQGKRRCGEKTPQHAHQVEILCRAFPSCRVVHLVRDPRDVVASLNRMPWGARCTAANARTWLGCVQAAERESSRENFLRVHYERLVDQPERELRRICRFIDEPFSSRMLEADPGARADQWWFQRAQGPLSSAHREKWREELSAADVAIVEWIAHDPMTALEYTPVTQPPGAGRRFLARSGEFLWGIREQVAGIPRLWYHWLQPTRLAAEEAWIDRRSRAAAAESGVGQGQPVTTE